MMRRLAERPGLVFGFVFAWKVLLLLLTAQPVPANDSFFYDGAVVNYLLHGKYVNPSLAEVLPISGKEVFSAYPPLYHLTLLGWMSLFGTSALAAMWLHVVLLVGYMLVVLGIFRRLNVPSRCASLAGLFLFSITFHDRPDTLAHVLGALAVYSAIRFQGVNAPKETSRVESPKRSRGREEAEDRANQLSPPRYLGGSEGQVHEKVCVADGSVGCIWSWLTAAFLLLALGTSLQIGAIYLLWTGLIVLVAAGRGWIGFPWWPVLSLIAVVGGLIALVRFGFPLLWEGFQEHATITPSLTGWRWPDVGDVLKVVRTAPGILLAGAFMVLLMARDREQRRKLFATSHGLVAMAGVLVAFAVIGACLLVITPNTVHIANYLQPIIVGCFLAVPREFETERLRRWTNVLFLAAAGLVSVRAVGMTTWGVACSADVDYRDSIELVRQGLSQTPAGHTVLLSSAYLYEAAHRSDLRWLHADWPGNAAHGESTREEDALIQLKPARLIVTQFDYYRRYEAVLNRLQHRPEVVSLKIHQTARVPSPDSIKSYRRVVQHLAWAPVVVEFSWE
jgi:hypothetical protein